MLLHITLCFYNFLDFNFEMSLDSKRFHRFINIRKSVIIFVNFILTIWSWKLQNNWKVVLPKICFACFLWNSTHNKTYEIMYLNCSRAKILLSWKHPSDLLKRTDPMEAQQKQRRQSLIQTVELWSSAAPLSGIM